MSDSTNTPYNSLAGSPAPSDSSNTPYKSLFGSPAPTTTPETPVKHTEDKLQEHVEGLKASATEQSKATEDITANSTSTDEDRAPFLSSRLAFCPPTHNDNNDRAIYSCSSASTGSWGTLPDSDCNIINYEALVPDEDISDLSLGSPLSAPESPKITVQTQVSPQITVRTPQSKPYKQASPNVPHSAAIPLNKAREERPKLYEEELVYGPGSHSLADLDRRWSCAMVAEAIESTRFDEDVEKARLDWGYASSF